MSQNSVILHHLQSAPITAMEAYEKYGCMRLGARILELRKHGYEIAVKMKHSQKKHWAEYYIPKEHLNTGGYREISSKFDNRADSLFSSFRRAEV